MNDKRRSTDSTRYDCFLAIVMVFCFFALLFVFTSTEVRSEEWTGAVGVNQSIYTDESPAEWSFGGQIGHERTPVYLWAAYEAPEVKVLGQPMGDTDIFSVGLGASQELVEGFSVFAEGGYSFVDLSANDRVVNEVAYTYLVGRHAVGDRVIPVPCAYGSRCYEDSYTVDDGFVARIGAKWQVTDHIAVRGAYKWAYFDQEITIRRPDWQEGTGYWREDTTLDLSSFELGVWYTF